MEPRIFISYRREDSQHFAGRLHERLGTEFGNDNLFMDVDTMPFGVDFVEELRKAVAKCNVLLAIIGPKWLDAKDDDGRRRLDKTSDFVRTEIGAALKRNIPVVPILVDGTKVPDADLLPKDLRSLVVRHGLNVRHDSFPSDVDRLVRYLKERIEDDKLENRGVIAAGGAICVEAI
jgi:TIR domain